MNTLHIFKPGRHIPVSGGAISFSESDLKASAEAYDPSLHEAPIVIGHPELDAPAFGWVSKLSVDEKGLHASTKQVSSEFSELVSSGAYKKISASFYSPDAPQNPVPGVYYLRHVGLLGAQPPAVKGLSSIGFAEDEDGVIAVEEETGGGLFKKFRNWLVKNKPDVADDILPEAKAALLDENAEPSKTEGSTAVTEVSKSEELVPELVEQLAAKEQELQAIRKEKAALEAKALQKSTVEAESFAERLVKEGRVSPRHKAVVVAFMEVASGKSKQTNGVLSFGEGTNQRPLLPAFKSFLNALPVAIDFGETATHKNAALISSNPLLADAERRAVKK